MNIEVEEKICSMVVCSQKNCPWKGVCANHYTAGDFRIEDGIRPILSLINGVVNCKTFHSKGYGYEYRDQPRDVGQHPYSESGLMDYNCVMWSELIEEGNNFSI